MAAALSKTKKYSMLNPEDCERVLQFILADASEDEEFSDGGSIGSDDEFSGDDVGDGSDEESAEELEFDCVADIDECLDVTDEQNDPGTSVQDTSSRKKSITTPVLNGVRVEDDSEHEDCGNGEDDDVDNSNSGDDDVGSCHEFKENHVNDFESAKRLNNFEDVQTPVRATGIDKMTLHSSTPVSLFEFDTLETPRSRQSAISEKRKVCNQVGGDVNERKHKPIHANGLVLADVAFVRDMQLKDGIKSVTSPMVLDFYGIEFNEEANRKKANKCLSKQINKLKEIKQKKSMNDYTAYLKSESAGNDIVLLFSNFGVSNVDDIQSGKSSNVAKSKLCMPASSSSQSETPQRVTETRGRKPKKWLRLKPCAVRKRKQNFSKDLAKTISEFADGSSNRLSTMDLYKEIGKTLFGDEVIIQEPSLKIPASKDLSLQTINKMSRRKMDYLRGHMKRNYNVSMASRRALQDEKKRRCVEVHDVREATNIKSIGVYCKFDDSVQQLINQFNELGIIPPPPLEADGHTRLKLYIKDGFDGAGNQLKIKGCSTGTMELMGYVALYLEDISDPKCTKRFWENECPNSHFCLRPLSLILEKESESLIRELYSLYPENYDPFIVKIGKRPILIDVDIKRSMLDGKVQSIVSGRTGSYCNYCKFTASTYYRKIINKNSDDPLSAELEFLTYEDLMKVWNQVKDRLNQKSSKRSGFCHKPISKQDHMSVLHMIINCCRTLLKNIAIAVSDDLDKKAINPIKNKTEEFNNTWKKTKKVVCATLLEKLKIRTMEIGRNCTGSGLTGGEARKFFQKSDQICDLIFPEQNEWREKFRKVMKKLRTLLFLLMSNEPIEVEAYRTISRVTLDMIVREIPWMRVIPSLHKVLCHGWQFIKRNDSKGLNILSEEALEAKQGYARRIRKFNCFQGNTETNLRQCHSHLQLESDPVLVGSVMGKTAKPKAKRKINPDNEDYKVLIDSKRKKKA